MEEKTVKVPYLFPIEFLLLILAMVAAMFPFKNIGRVSNESLEISDRSAFWLSLVTGHVLLVCALGGWWSL